MASLEDYDEFGNYIGADLDSDDEEDLQQESYAPPQQDRQPSHVPLEGFDEDERPSGADSMALVGMDVDGEIFDGYFGNDFNERPLRTGT